LCELRAERIWLHEIDEGLFSVDLDDRKQLSVARLQAGVAVDRDLLELESELLAKREHGRARPLAEVATGRVIEAD
jgi:hypothetical protein